MIQINTNIFDFIFLIGFFSYIADLITSTCGQTDEEDLSGWHFYISGVLTAGTGVVGLLGNILSVVTLLHK